MIVMLDNRDSFVFNLARYLQLLGTEVVVLPSHTTSPTAVAAYHPQGVVVSPGPCSPAEAGFSVACIQQFRGLVPVLGVCLGHQAIVAAEGGRIVRAAAPRHGRTSEVFHDATNLFAGLPSPLRACRYHSLVADPVDMPSSLTVTARTADGVVMAVADEPAALYGVQFHPESVLTQGGFRLLANFLERAGLAVDAQLVGRLDAEVGRQAGDAPKANVSQADARVVTF
jgi:anthranilate synthase/aminodeoxychorismate synthase-like glutamine amidotransferase